MCLLVLHVRCCMCRLASVCADLHLSLHLRSCIGRLASVVCLVGRGVFGVLLLWGGWCGLEWCGLVWVVLCWCGLVFGVLLA